MIIILINLLISRPYYLYILCEICISDVICLKFRKLIISEYWKGENRILILFLYMTGIALLEYSRIRNKDVEAMCDLAMYNYIEVTEVIPH